MMMVGALYCTDKTSWLGSIIANTKHLGLMPDDDANLMSANIHIEL